MRSSVRNILDSNSDYWTFLKERPYWVRILSIEPERIDEFVLEYKTIRRKRFIDKVEDTSNLLTIIQALMES